MGSSGGRCEVAGRLKEWVQQYKAEHDGRKPQKHQLPGEIREKSSLSRFAGLQGVVFVVACPALISIILELLQASSTRFGNGLSRAQSLIRLRSPRHSLSRLSPTAVQPVRPQKIVGATYLHPHKKMLTPNPHVRLTHSHA